MHRVAGGAEGEVRIRANGMKENDPEVLRWVREPDFDYIEQDMDVVLLAVFDAAELCGLLRLATLKDKKKQWVVMALVAIMEEEISKPRMERNLVLLKEISNVLREYPNICRGVIPDLGAGSGMLLEQVLTTEFPHGFSGV